MRTQRISKSIIARGFKVPRRLTAELSFYTFSFNTRGICPQKSKNEITKKVRLIGQIVIERVTVLRDNP